MELNNNGLIVSIYRNKQEWKVIHCSRVGARFGKSVVHTFKSKQDAISYAKLA